MKIQATLNGVKVEREIPTSWKQVTYSNFLDLKAIGNDDLGIISYFTVIDKNTLRKAKIRNLDAVLNALNFLRSDIDTTLPESVFGYKIPKNLEFETLAQYEDLKKAISEAKDEDDLLRLYPLFCGTFTMDSYDPLTVDDFSRQFFNAPCGEVLAVGNFTLKKLGELSQTSKPISPQAVTLLKRLRLAINAYLINLAFTLRYFSWRKKHRIEDTNS